MTFRYHDQHRDEYNTTGLTVLRGLIPPALLTDLRHEADTARDLARRLHGAQTQRLQPVWEFPELDQRPFHEFHALPELRAAVDGILGPDRPRSEVMGILLEPATDPWCTGWHRDWLDTPDLDPAERPAMLSDLAAFNQYNAAIHDDHSLWVVPDSHARESTPAELAVPTTAPTFAPGTPAAERERACLEYARAMPGAVPVVLFAGDVLFYRNTTWHIGNYVPYVKRATLHDGFYGPTDRAWLARFNFLESIREQNKRARSAISASAS